MQISNLVLYAQFNISYVLFISFFFSFQTTQINNTYTHTPGEHGCHGFNNNNNKKLNEWNTHTQRIYENSISVQKYLFFFAIIIIIGLSKILTFKFFFLLFTINWIEIFFQLFYQIDILKKKSMIHQWKIFYFIFLSVFLH